MIEEYLTGLDPQTLELFFQVGLAGAVMVFTIIMSAAFIYAVTRIQGSFATAIDRNNDRWKAHLAEERQLDRVERENIMAHTTRAIENSYSRIGAAMNGVEKQLERLSVATVNHDRRMTILMAKMDAGEQLDVELPDIEEGLKAEPFVREA